MAPLSPEETPGTSTCPFLGWSTAGLAPGAFKTHVSQGVQDATFLGAVSVGVGDEEGVGG